MPCTITAIVEEDVKNKNPVIWLLAQSLVSSHSSEFEFHSLPTVACDQETG